MKRCASLVLLLLSAACGSSPAPTPTPIVPTFTAPSDPRFDLGFYRQLAHNALDNPVHPLQRLTQSPAIYLQRTGLSDAFVAQLEQTARDLIPAFTGGALALAGWETGTEAPADRAGWITVTLRNDESANCGNANVGLAAGHIWLNTASRCGRNGEPVMYASGFAHELGHALGFWHVDGGLMRGGTISTDATLSDRERYHGALAYQQPIGSLAN